MRGRFLCAQYHDRLFRRIGRLGGSKRRLQLSLPDVAFGWSRWKHSQTDISNRRLTGRSLSGCDTYSAIASPWMGLPTQMQFLALIFVEI
jgi:hypothetical protein